jgi:hypothetical protein
VFARTQAPLQQLQLFVLSKMWAIENRIIHSVQSKYECNIRYGNDEVLHYVLQTNDEPHQLVQTLLKKPVEEK